jgi:hypothetical protein
MLRRIVSMHPKLKYELVHENSKDLLKSKSREQAIKILTYPATQEGRLTGSIMSILSGQKLPYTEFSSCRKYTKKFMSLFPEGCIIHIVRNPIDTISSQVRTFSKKTNKCVKNFFESVPKVRKFLNSFSNVLEISYEEIISNPKDTIALIYKWIETEVEPSHIEKVISKKDPWIYEGRVMPGLRYFEKIENRGSKNIVLSTKQINEIKELCKKYDIYY